MDDNPEDAATRFRTEKPKMAECAELSYYLAGIVESEFALAPSAEALNRVRDLEDYSGVADYAELFGVAELEASIAADGGVTGLSWDADYQPWPLLSALAPWVKDGSYFLLIDDGGFFHRATFRKGQLVFEQQAVEPDWLRRIRADAKRVTEQLTAAGWALDEAAMKQERDSVAYWGAAAKAEIDAECPATVLACTKGPFTLRFSYRGHDKGAWISLKLKTRSPFSQMAVDYPKAELRDILAAIVAGQDELAGENWQGWLKAHKKQLRATFDARNDSAYFVEVLDK